MNDFINDLKSNGIELTDEMISSFSTYYKSLIETNKTTNLTRITEEKEVYYLHFYDSLMVSKALPTNKNKLKLLDVGAGAGFPSIPLKIVYPEINLTIVEATNKKVKFLDSIIEELKLSNVRTLHLRAEDFKEYDTYDYVTARAVAELKNLVMSILPLLKIGGSFIAMKTLSNKEELEEALPIIKDMGGILEKTIPYDVLDRHYVLYSIKKISPSPKLKVKPNPKNDLIINLGDVYEFKKPHLCGANKWEVIRSGVDCKIKCLGCGRITMVERIELKKSIKKQIKKGISSN